MNSRILLVAGFATLGITIGVEALRPVFVTVALLLTLGILRLSKNPTLSMREVIFFAFVFRLLLLPALPALSDDAFRYIWDGMLQWNGFNPFLHVPAAAELTELRGHPVFDHLNSPGYHTVYPPIAQALFWSAGWIPPTSWPLSYLLMKGLVATCEFAAVLLLARMVKPAALVLYAWNPLVVIETSGQLHTESLMVLALVVSIWAFRHGRIALSLGSLTAALWVKLYPVFLLPFLLRRVGWRKLWLVIVVSAIIIAPYAHWDIVPNMISSLSLYVGLFEFYSGPYLLLKWLGYKLGGSAGLELFVGLSLALVFLLIILRLYVLDRARSWSLPMACFFVFAGFILTATTVHPWYFIGLLALLAMTELDPRSWLWLSAFSIPTYLLYTHDVYWPFVWIGWTGWAILLVTTTKSARAMWLDGIRRMLKNRAVRKARLIQPHLEDGTEELARSLSVLDLGAGEGYVGRALQDFGRYNVTLCDVRASNDTELPFVVYDGLELPFGDDWFDSTMIVFTLHHCEDHVSVLREASRVTSGRIVILESVYVSEMGRRMLALLDRWANNVRSRGGMDTYQHFRKTEDWIELLESTGFQIESVRRWGRIHRQALIVATR